MKTILLLTMLALLTQAHRFVPAPVEGCSTDEECTQVCLDGGGDAEYCADPFLR